MNLISNTFSVLNLDAEDDKEQMATATTSAVDGTDATKSVIMENDHSQFIHKKNSMEGQGNNKKRKGSGKVAPPKIDNNETKVPPSGEIKYPLVWIDMEMTGLDVEVDRILEIACIITDGNLNKLIEGPDLVIHQTEECLNNMGEWCKKHHAASGLTKRVLQSKISEQNAEQQVVEFVKNHVGTYTPLLAGNSVYVDFLFLKKYMPDLASLFSHVIVDVSSVKALCIRWFPRENKKAPPKENKHRAMDDIRESILELKYYKEHIFKGSKTGR